MILQVKDWETSAQKSLQTRVKIVPMCAESWWRGKKTTEELEIKKGSHNEDEKKESSESLREAGKEALNQAVRTRIYMRWSGKDYDQFRKDLSNGNIVRSREQPDSVDEAIFLIEQCRPLLFRKKRTMNIW